MADDFEARDYNNLAIWIRATELNDGPGIRKAVHNIVRGYLLQGDVATSERIVLIGGIRRAIVSSLEGADGTAAQLITDGDGRLRVTVEGTTSFVQPGASGFEVQVAEQHGAIYTSAGVELTVKYFQAEVAGNSSNQSIIAAVTNKRIVVTSLSETVGSTATTVTWLNGSAGSTLSKHAWDAYGGRVMALNPHGHFRTSAGTGLFMTTSAGGDTTYVEGTYIEV